MVVISLRFDDVEDVAHTYSKNLTGKIDQDRAKLRILKSLAKGLRTELKSYKREGDTLEKREAILKKIQHIIEKYPKHNIYMPKI